MNLIKWITEWFKNNCDEDWEHCYGIQIVTLDNPGWLIKIDILDTGLEEKEFTSVNKDISEDDWIICEIKDGVFKGSGDIGKLEEILKIFKNWAEKCSE